MKVRATKQCKRREQARTANGATQSSGRSNASGESLLIPSILDIVQMKVPECDLQMQSYNSHRLCEEVASIFLGLVDLMDHFRIHQRGPAT